MCKYASFWVHWNLEDNDGMCLCVCIGWYSLQPTPIIRLIWAYDDKHKPSVDCNIHIVPEQYHTSTYSNDRKKTVVHPYLMHYKIVKYSCDIRLFFFILHNFTHYISFIFFFLISAHLFLCRYVRYSIISFLCRLCLVVYFFFFLFLLWQTHSCSSSPPPQQ